jgi:heptosyltransferase-2
MKRIEKILIVQTAFIGDAILTLPLVQVVKRLFPAAPVDVVVAPRTKDLFANHPDIRQVVVYDKRGVDRGLGGLLRMKRRLSGQNYSVALVPHRSLRSALLVWLLRIPHRIGFDKSAGKLLLSQTVKYRRELHEIERNLSLLRAMGIALSRTELPCLYPSARDRQRVDKLLFEYEVGRPDNLIAIAPGTIWNTKRWLKERYASLAVRFDDEGFEVVLIGGREDAALCDEIQKLSGSSKVYNTAGKLTLLQSAELVRRSKALVTNDSAPMHIGVAMETPVVAIFGATVPAFGFGPVGRHDAVVETRDLKCRPCSIHGGDKCPIKTFDCMNDITYERVFETVMLVLHKAQKSSVRR